VAEAEMCSERHSPAGRSAGSLKSANPPPIIFDYCVCGFGRKYEERFRLLGFSVLFVGEKWKDFVVRKYVEKNNGILVTSDKEFEGYSRAIVLAKRKYEEMWSELWRKWRTKNQVFSLRQ